MLAAPAADNPLHAAPVASQQPPQSHVQAVNAGLHPVGGPFHPLAVAWLSSLQSCRSCGQSFSKPVQSVQQMASLDGFRETV